MNRAEYTQIWNLIPLATPKIIKRCPRCDKDRFYSSDKFRVNAHQKKIDAWLVYKCIRCDYTYNLPIISRKTVLKINNDLLCQLKDNNKEKAYMYAFNINATHSEILLDWNIEIQTNIQYLKPADSLYSPKILVQAGYNMKIPINTFLREQMKLSRSQIEKLYESKKLELYSFEGNVLNLKSYISKGFTMILSFDNFSLLRSEDK